LPALIFGAFRRVYRLILVKILPGLKSGLYKCDLDSLLMQWYHTLFYKINTDIVVSIPTTIIYFEDDPIIRSSSIKNAK